LKPISAPSGIASRRTNKAFVEAYEKDYGAVPGSYAFQAYDAALLIDSALKATKGDTANKDALRAALQKADFRSLRGDFKFNANHYPIQDFYLVKVASARTASSRRRSCRRSSMTTPTSTPRIAR
jgi:ABC-type branched-subunit amino acid transport system substrate-binding protein